MRTLSDSQLLSQIQEGNQRAFTAFFDRYKGRLLRHVYQKTDSVYEAEEIVQNIFISFWKNRQSIVIRDSALPYLLAAARNSVLQFFVRTYAGQQLESLREDQQPSDHTQEDYIVADDLENYINAVIGKMPATMRRSFELSRKENLSVKEIAELMHLSEQTVKNNLTMALQRLRSKLSGKHVLSIFLAMHSAAGQMIKLLTS